MQYKNSHKMKNIIIVLSLILFGLHIQAQSFDKDLASFKKSIEQEKNGEYSSAVSTLKKTYQENSYEYNMRLGWLDYLAGQYTESSTYYHKAIILMPLSIEARFSLIYPQLALGKTTQAIETYKEILKISPNDTQANYRLGLIYYQQAKYKEAEIRLKKVINLYPFDYDTVILLAWNSLQMGKTNEAKVLFQKALLYRPTDESATEGLRQVN
jgi:tetratricopeptide (TPR) repeat protein